MIYSLHLQDYESHKDTLLEFPPGLTVFIGESDKGKSGTFRAFNWNRINRPLGDGMRPIYWNSKETKVEVTLDGWSSITRGKGKSDNYYEVNAHKVYKKYNAGTEVPEMVNQFMDMEDNIYFQSQIDRPFLMFESSGERGRILNKISGLDKIDTCIKNANQDVNKMNSRNKNIKIEINQLKEELLKFSTLSEIKELIEQAEQLERLIQNKQHDLKTVETLLPKKIKYKKIIQKKGELLQISKKLEESSKLSDLIENKGKLLIKVKALKIESKELESKLNKASYLGSIKAKLNLLKKQADKLDQLEVRYDKVNILDSRYTKKDSRLLVIEKEIDIIKKKLPNVCPECGEPIK